MQSQTKKKWVMAIAVPMLGAAIAVTACGDDGDDDGAGGGGSGGSANGGSAGTPTGGAAGNFGIQHVKQNNAPTARGGSAGD